MKSMALAESPTSAWYWAASSAAGWLAGAGSYEDGSQAGMFRNAIASASRACPAALPCAWPASAVSASAVLCAVSSSSPVSGVAGLPSSWAIAYSPSSW